MTDYSSHLVLDGVAIFLFHGVVRSLSRPVRNYTRKHIPEQDFERVLDDLLVNGSPVSMSDVAEYVTGVRELPPRAFAVTFDDGFENNFSVAAPQLERRAVPAMFYATTRFIDVNASSWIDRIEAAVESCASVALDLPLLPLVARCADDGSKRAVLDRIRAVVKARRDLDPYGVAEEVERQLGVTQLECDAALDAKMTWDQLAALHRHSLFTVGGHGHTHRVLAFLDAADLDAEISESLRLMEQHIGEPVRHYSYPEGLAHCYSDEVIARLTARGIVCAPTAEPGVNRAGDDPFRLKRIMVA